MMKMKLVYESLNEMNFQRKMNDPLGALGIGREKLIRDWLEDCYVDDYIINDDFTINVPTAVGFSILKLKKIPDFIQFDKIDGSFYFTNSGLVSLKGCPRIVKGTFDCTSNDLVSLEHCPTHIGGNFWCGGNKIKFTEEYVRKICNV